MVSHKDARSEVRWTALGYTFVEKEEGKIAIDFTAEIRLRDNDTMVFSGTWNTAEPEELLSEMAFHSERMAQDRRVEINRLQEEIRQTEKKAKTA